MRVESWDVQCEHIPPSSASLRKLRKQRDEENIGESENKTTHRRSLPFVVVDASDSFLLPTCSFQSLCSTRHVTESTLK